MERIYKEIVVSLETAKNLKQLGFNEDCISYYNNDCFFDYHTGYFSLNYHRNSDSSEMMNMYAAPRLDTVQKWLREKNNISIEIFSRLDLFDGNFKPVWFGQCKFVNTSELMSQLHESFNTYEDALRANIDFIIDYLLNLK